ncbi:uncharacterized protein PV07_02607 [Cladophialophora immunda]|uniref:Protein kinase domain-containing protein n=1 Tax=Cladophialophora immunda TaxID=569365 RepID=A0A0D2CLG9_9EURO|nr:uncharacterized protein PV07_02607 [Cladophialophora immunda]KIW30915.1 hypothetical protein PV07_02607 [Cladophialophora immunda]
MDFNFHAWADDKRVRALLLPLSDAARYSIALPQNKTHVDLLGPRPPSPPAEGNGRDFDDEEQPQVLVEQTMRTAKKALVLRQNKVLDRFTFGSDLGNYFVLSGDPASKDHVCYINIYHCQLFPDPDFSEIWLQNLSASEQTVREWPLSSQTRSVAPKESTRLRASTWILNLGEGLRFLLHVFPLSDVYQPSMYTLSAPSEIVTAPHAPSGQKTDLRRRTKPARADVKNSTRKTDDTSLEDIYNSPKQTVTVRQESTAKTQVVGKFIGETRYSRIEEGKALGKRVAIKFCRHPDIPVAANMWRTEVHALKALCKHQNVVQFLESDAEKYSITMELVPGMSLEKYVDRQFTSTLTEMQSMDIWLGAAQGLQWVHQKGFFYNDLKAENTMYDPKSRRTVLIDFGLASPENLTYFIGGGTPCYVCPEYIRRERHQVSDIWSLAIVIMFTFRLIELPRETWDLTQVFDDTSPHREKMDAWHDGIWAKANTAPSRHLELLRRMLRKSTRDRIRAHELVACLQEVHHSHELLA